METQLSCLGIATEISEQLESDDPKSLERLESLLPALEQRAAAVGRWVNYQEDLADAIKAREVKVIAARRAIEGRAERAKAYLRSCMELAGAMKITDSHTGMTLALQKNPPSVVVDDEVSIPSEYWRIPEPPPPALDKKALASALKAGPVPGVHAEQTFRLVIK